MTEEVYTRDEEKSLKVGLWVALSIILIVGLISSARQKIMIWRCSIKQTGNRTARIHHGPVFFERQQAADAAGIFACGQRRYQASAGFVFRRALFGG